MVVFVGYHTRRSGTGCRRRRCPISPSSPVSSAFECSCGHGFGFCRCRRGSSRPSRPFLPLLAQRGRVFLLQFSMEVGTMLVNHVAYLELRLVPQSAPCYSRYPFFTPFVGRHYDA